MQVAFAAYCTQDHGPIPIPVSLSTMLSYDYYLFIRLLKSLLIGFIVNLETENLCNLRKW